NFDEAIERIDSVHLDTIAIAEMVGRSYLLENRTLVKEVKRLSWMTSFDRNNEYDLMNQLPIHNNKIIGLNDIAMEFKHQLKKELSEYIDGKKNIGVLLSGGYDSRILAGLLRELQLKDKSIN